MQTYLPTGVAVLGSPAGRLLAGRPEPEDLRKHLERLGPLPHEATSPVNLLASLTASGLTGRGGGHFPLVEKVRSALTVPGPRVVVVNGCEGEPASAKDHMLLVARPHVVLDGAQALAVAVGADRIIVATHAGADSCVAIGAARRERPDIEIDVTVATVPGRYVASESSALVSFLNGAPARPTGRKIPTALAGVDGRPTVLSNAETVAHVGLIARFGAEWFRQAGSATCPGSTLLTIAGDVSNPGSVVEALGATTLREAIRAAGGSVGVPGAILLGGYAGTWLRAATAWDAPVDAGRLAAAGVSLGCGLVGVLGADRCGLVETARIVNWLSGERAGQCGACSLGLPEMAAGLSDLASGVRRGRRMQRRMVAVGEVMSGRGLCRLPDGAASMVESALVVFAEELRLHRRGRCSARVGGPGAFPLPDQGPEGTC